MHTTKFSAQNHVAETDGCYFTDYHTWLKAVVLNRLVQVFLVGTCMGVFVSSLHNISLSPFEFIQIRI